MTLYYELWNCSSCNMVGSYDTLDEALKDVESAFKRDPKMLNAIGLGENDDEDVKHFRLMGEGPEELMKLIEDRKLRVRPES